MSRRTKRRKKIRELDEERKAHWAAHQAKLLEYIEAMKSALPIDEDHENRKR